MQRKLHALGMPTHHDLVQTAKEPPLVGIPDHQFSSDGHVPSATITGPYTVGSHSNFGTPSQYTTNVGYDDPSSPVAGLEERPQYAYQGAPHFPPPGTAQHTFDLPTIPGPLQPEYYAPLARVCTCSPTARCRLGPSDWVRSRRCRTMEPLLVNPPPEQAPLKEFLALCSPECLLGKSSGSSLIDTSVTLTRVSTGFA
ncbi:hypothetical protein BGW80DRAFT_256086 [Lactifluus volemus]|nr:hypothetical protein BGW80DRAFT_256086 [Lactifluus volemus]